MEQPQRDTYHDDEISFVDLAKILIRRRWWLIGTGAVIMLLALAFALLTRGDPEYRYTSIYQQAEIEPGEPLTSSASLIQQMKSLHWPNFKRNYKDENNVRVLPFDLEIENPENTTLITLSSTATEGNYEEVASMHKKLLENTIERQQEIFESQLSQLESAIERVSTLLERVENSNSDMSVEMAANYADRLFQLERKLESLKEGEVLETVAKGEKQSDSLSTKLILALGVILAGFLGVIMAFFVEFVGRVCESLRKEKRN